MGKFFNFIIEWFFGIIIAIFILLPSIVISSIWKFVQIRYMLYIFFFISGISVATLYYNPWNIVSAEWKDIESFVIYIIGGILLLFIYANAWSYYLFAKAEALYKDGEYIKAFVMLEPLAESENDEAQLLLAKIYDLGLGVQKSNAEAFKWYNKSAEQGNIEALESLEKFIEINSGGEHEAEQD